MKILEAWNAEPRSIDAAKDVVVAVIDTGINKKHEDLKENLWENPGEFEVATRNQMMSIAHQVVGINLVTNLMMMEMD